MKDCRFFIAGTRRDTDWNFFCLRRAVNCLGRSSFIAAYELKVAVNDHLRRIDAPEATLLCVGTLPFAVFVRSVGILPSDIVLVVHVFTQNDQIHAAYRLRSVESF